MEEYIEELESRLAVSERLLRQRSSTIADEKLRALNYKLMLEVKNSQRQIKEMEASIQHVTHQNTVLSNIFDAMNKHPEGHALMVQVVRKLRLDPLTEEDF